MQHLIPETLDELIREAMDEWQVSGLSLAVVGKDQPEDVKAFGLRDVEAGLPVTPDTQFILCSITKSFTALGLAMLADDGLLDWEKPVREYLPDFRLHDAIATDRVTVQDCCAIAAACRATTGSGCPATFHAPRCSQPFGISSPARISARIFSTAISDMW